MVFIAFANNMIFIVLAKKVDFNSFWPIYDFIIVPPASFTEQGKVLIEREMGRVEEMGQDAENKKEIG